MKTCKGCKWAEWRRTAAGKLHPSGDGRCTFPIRIPVIPLAFRWWYGDPKPSINGGFIKRNTELRDHCPCYAPEDSALYSVAKLKKAESE